jgi:dGTPase
MLAHLRFPVERSRGRLFPEPDHPYRNAFQRDRDRIVHSRAFRRLEAKTQVFSPGLSDHFRNRLTHTIEVAQIARTLASVLKLDEDLTEALALAHDIGHPPFAHAGEEELNRQMARFGDRFEHNLHALRIVESFEQRYARFPGLNLTFEVREGIIKHSRDYPPADYPQLAEYQLDQRPPLEAQLIDLTDEVAYNTADLDDGYEAKLLKLPELRERVAIFDRFYRQAEQQYPAAMEKLKFNEALKRMLDRMASDLITNTRARLEAAGVKSLEQVRAHRERLAAFSPEVDAERVQAKAFLNQRLYSNSVLEPEKAHAERVIAELFEYWVAHPEALPKTYREKARHEPPHRVICDYIAGMTDHYILEQHQKACGSKSAKVR